MNEDLLRTLMSDVDPVRNLSDETLDELVPNDQLMARVLLDIEQPSERPVRARDSIWRRTSFRVSTAAAAVVLVASGAVAFWGSSPSVLPSGLAVGAVHSEWVLYKGVTLVKAATPAGYETSNPAALRWLVNDNRVQTTLRLDGFTITSPATSVRPTVSARFMSEELWSTTALRGKSPVIFGFGDLTMNRSVEGGTRIRDAPVWIAIATTQPCSSAIACNASHLTTLPLTVAVSGYGLPNSAAKSGTPIAFVYQSAGSGSTTKPKLLPAILQSSVAWTQIGPVTNHRLDITTGPFPCGALHGYSFEKDASGSALTIESLTPESTLGDYCASSIVVHKVIPLTETSDGATRWLVNLMARIVHAPTGPIEATK